MKSSLLSNLIRSHWFWFIVLISAYSIYDCYEHITRENEIFAEYPIRWALFTLCSFASVIIVSYFTSSLIHRLGLPELWSSVLGNGTAIFVHLTVTGPLWDQLFWFDELFFNAAILPVLIFSGVYLIFRMVFSIIFKLVGQ